MVIMVMVMVMIVVLHGYMVVVVVMVMVVMVVVHRYMVVVVHGYMMVVVVAQGIWWWWYMVSMVKNTHTYHSDLVNISTNFLRRLALLFTSAEPAKEELMTSLLSQAVSCCEERLLRDETWASSLDKSWGEEEEEEEEEVGEEEDFSALVRREMRNWRLSVMASPEVEGKEASMRRSVTSK